MIVKGYRGKISVDEAITLADRGIYVFNALAVGCSEHLIYAYRKAKGYFERGENIASKMHIEIMLILTGRRQIKDALRLAGIDGAGEIAAISEKDFDLNLERDDSVLECKNKKIEYLGIDALVPGKECDAFFENSAMLHLHR